VKRRVLAWAGFAVLATIALLLARVFEPRRLGLELDIWALAIGGLALLNGVLLVREAYPLEGRTMIGAALVHEESEPKRPPQLERIERELSMASATAFDLHSRLRPLLREIATSRLAARGERLEDGEAELGEELWELVRPDHLPPSDRHAAGIEPAALRRAVERLEAL
jgi:hypothetical protein